MRDHLLFVNVHRSYIDTVRCCFSSLHRLHSWYVYPHFTLILQTAKATALKAGLHASLLGLFDAALFRAWPTAKAAGVNSSSVVKCSNYKHGDFQCNVAMPLFTALKVINGFILH